MTERIVGIQLMPSPFAPGIAAIPVVPFPSTEAERTRTAEEASRAALLLKRPSKGQIELFRYLAENAPDGRYVVTKAVWIETILKATKHLSEGEMMRLHAFDWAERETPPEELREELMTALKELDRR